MVERVTSVLFLSGFSSPAILNVWDNRIGPLCKARTRDSLCEVLYLAFFPKQAYHDFHRDSFCCCCCWEMRVNRRVEFGSNASQSAHVNQKVRYFKDIPMSFFSANFILLRYSLIHYRNGFRPTCVSSLPTAEFLSLHPDDRIYFVPHPWLHWMGVVELGHWCL